MKNWEEKFDDKFHPDSDYGLIPRESIKQFIRTLLEEQRVEIKKWVEENDYEIIGEEDESEFVINSDNFLRFIKSQ